MSSMMQGIELFATKAFKFTDENINGNNNNNFLSGKSNEARAQSLNGSRGEKAPLMANKHQIER